MTKFDKHRIIWIDSIDSTNNEVRRNIDAFDNLSVLAAYEQTSGRGQPRDDHRHGIIHDCLPTDEGIAICKQHNIQMPV